MNGATGRIAPGVLGYLHFCLGIYCSWDLPGFGAHPTVVLFHGDLKSFASRSLCVRVLSVFQICVCFVQGLTYYVAHRA